MLKLPSFVVATVDQVKEQPRYSLYRIAMTDLTMIKQDGRTKLLRQESVFPPSGDRVVTQLEAFTEIGPHSYAGSRQA